jgi:hypothetical protein
MGFFLSICGNSIHVEVYAPIPIGEFPEGFQSESVTYPSVPVEKSLIPTEIIDLGGVN